MCRHPLTETDKLIAPNPDLSTASVKDESDTPAEMFDSETKSSKTEALMGIVRATLAKSPESKIVVFSQWTSFLDIIQAHLHSSEILHARIDGRMSAPARDRAIHALDNDPSCRVLLASLSVCSVGLNLVSADTVILADSWWAPAIEDQAVDRVHRLGQTRATTVWRLVVEGSVEERVLEVQKEKRGLVGRAFREKGARGEGREADLRRLLG
jgi:SWI/SNF-related matrix-associated actin-dependent regulator of chromatin subfamily A3